MAKKALSDLYRRAGRLPREESIEGCHRRIQCRQVDSGYGQLFDGDGNIFTGNSFMKMVQDLDATKKVKAEEKARKVDMKRQRKEAIEAVEREWARIKEEHEAALHAWEERCSGLAAQKVPKWSWLKKPVRAHKPTLPSPPEANNDGDNDEDEQDDEEMDV
ncbi:hypothetical protein CPB84DRAFT_1785962 [Gymnopilus junonius]|uniref:Uncharacterized protein n=1 Tax=Gymnopilus junonius TaxID=109634 RepID=A0A9P5TJM0_GYMJU|nr:hypothetical protein CPB84DRAFT_1785962 [Gymnopilus junonius]